MLAQDTGFLQGRSVSMGGEDIYQRLLRSNHVSDETAPTDVILEISTHFYLKPIKQMRLGGWALSPHVAKTRGFSAEAAASCLSRLVSDEPLENNPVITSPADPKSGTWESSQISNSTECLGCHDKEVITKGTVSTKEKREAGRRSQPVSS